MSYNKAVYEKNKEYFKNYYKINKKQIRNYQKEYWKNYKKKFKPLSLDQREKLRASQREYYKKNKDRLLSYRKEYYHKNKAKFKRSYEGEYKIYQQEYYKNNKDKFREYGKIWRKNNPDYFKERFKLSHVKLKIKRYRHKSRHKRRALSYGLDLQIYKEIVKQCANCGFNKYLVDLHHIDKNNKNSDLNNLIGLCPNCHMGYHRGKINIDFEKLKLNS